MTTINIKELEKRIQDVQLETKPGPAPITYKTAPMALAHALSWQQQNWLSMVHSSLDRVGDKVSRMVTPLERDPSRASKMDRLGRHVSGWIGH